MKISVDDIESLILTRAKMIVNLYEGILAPQGDATERKATVNYACEEMMELARIIEVVDHGRILGIAVVTEKADAA